MRIRLVFLLSLIVILTSSTALHTTRTRDASLMATAIHDSSVSVPILSSASDSVSMVDNENDGPWHVWDEEVWWKSSKGQHMDDVTGLVNLPSYEDDVYENLAAQYDDQWNVWDEEVFDTHQPSPRKSSAHHQERLLYSTKGMDILIVWKTFWKK
jgi:hypothetical protein